MKTAIAISANERFSMFEIELQGYITYYLNYYFNYKYRAKV